MMTQFATQVHFATQTIDYSNDLSGLTLGLILLVGLSAGMIILEAWRPRCAPTFRLATALLRGHQAQGHAA